jgi:hypothetical protein
MKYLGFILLILIATNLNAQTFEDRFETQYHNRDDNGFDVNLEIQYSIDSLMGEPVVKAQARYTIGESIDVDGKRYEKNQIPDNVLNKIKIIDLVLALPFSSSEIVKSDHIGAWTNLFIDVDLGALSYPGKKWSFNPPGSPDWGHWIYYDYFGEQKYVVKPDAIRLFKTQSKTGSLNDLPGWLGRKIKTISFDVSPVRDWLKESSLYPLSIKPEPSDAIVQIVNIKPVYYNGIGLKEGRYQISVRKEGFVKQTMWVNLSADQTEFTVVLKKSPEEDDFEALLDETEKTLDEEDFLESIDEDQDRLKATEEAMNDNMRFAGKSPLEKIAGYGLQARLSPFTAKYNTELNACSDGKPNKPAAKFKCRLQRSINLTLTSECYDCEEISAAQAARNKEAARREKAENRRRACSRQERQWEKAVREYPSALSKWKHGRESCLLRVKQRYDDSIDSLIQDAESANALMEEFK